MYRPAFIRALPTLLSLGPEGERLTAGRGLADANASDLLSSWSAPLPGGQVHEIGKATARCIVTSARSAAGRIPASISR